MSYSLSCVDTNDPRWGAKANPKTRNPNTHAAGGIAVPRSESVIPRTVMNEMFNRYAIGVRAHADGIGVKQANVSSETVRSINIELHVVFNRLQSAEYSTPPDHSAELVRADESE